MMLQQEAGWVAVLDGDRFLGVLTPESLHAALRRSVEGTVPEAAGRQVSSRTVAVAGRGSRRLACAPVGSSSSGGTRQTDSSQSAAATSAGGADDADRPR